METQSVVNSVLIGLSAVVMIISIVRYGHSARSLDSINLERRSSFHLHFAVHRALMAFFLLGYLGAIAAIIMKYPLLSETFVSFIFLAGSLFVYLDVVIQLKLIEEVMRDE